MVRISLQRWSLHRLMPQDRVRCTAPAVVQRLISLRYLQRIGMLLAPSADEYLGKTSFAGGSPGGFPRCLPGVSSSRSRSRSRSLSLSLSLPFCCCQSLFAHAFVHAGAGAWIWGCACMTACMYACVHACMYVCEHLYVCIYVSRGI